jgi:hypothetical protein
VKAEAGQKPDLATQAKRLREQTCQLLGLDINKLTASQLVRVDRASVLRLRLSDLEAMQLNGAHFDAREYVLVSEEYEKLLNFTDHAELGTLRGEADARQRVLELISGIAPDVLTQAERNDQLEAEVTDLREANAELRAELAELRAAPHEPMPAQPPEPAPNIVPIRNPSERAWAASYYGTAGAVPYFPLDPTGQR